MSEVFEHIVVGAGISGLSLAHRAARRGIPTLVLESAERVGGCINSRTFAHCGDFWAEGGSHTCFNSYGHLIDTLGDLGMLDRLTAKEKVKYFLWRGGKRRPVFSALHPLELAISLPALLTGRKAERSVRDYYGAGLGRKNYRDLFGPAFRAVICQDADDFPADLLFRRKRRRKEILRSFTVPGGLSEIPQAIASQDRLQVRTGQEIVQLRRDGDGFRLATAAGHELRCATLALAVPPDVASGLLAHDFLELADAAGGIGVEEVESVALCVPAEGVAHLPALAGLIAVDDAFNSMVSRDYLPDARYRGFTFHFRPGALGADAQVARACDVLGISSGDVAGAERLVNRLPALRVGHAERIARIDGALAGTRLGITGNWFLGVSIEDCVTRSHREHERLFGRAQETP
jgi:protoporphyrinogen oxidase